MKKTALLFPGQGSQYIGMGEELLKISKEAQLIFEEANDALGFDLKKLCLEGDANVLMQTENAQPALLTLSTAIGKYIEANYNIHPAFLAGHSLGEYSALVQSGAIAFGDAVKIVRKRGEFMKEAAAGDIGAMAAVMRCDDKTLEEICKESSREGEIVVIANYNSSKQTVISGHKLAVARAIEKVEKLDLIAKILQVSGPFHSPLMESAADKLKNELMKYKYSSMKCPVISNVTATPYGSEKDIISNLTKQLTSSVCWTKTIEYMATQGVNSAIEIGPKMVLTKLMKDNNKSIEVCSTDTMKDIEKLNNEIEFKKMNLKELDPDMTLITRCMAMAVSTQNTNWNQEAYNEGVVAPYKKIQNMQDALEEQKSQPTKAQMLEALELLKVIFKTKGVDVKEQQERIHQILVETETTDLLNEFTMPE